MLRRCTVATWCAAWRSALGAFELTICVRVRPAPYADPFFFSSATPVSETKTFGAIWRRFMFGSRSVPPAISIAFGPSPARTRVASASVFGARYSNQGSRIMPRP